MIAVGEFGRPWIGSFGGVVGALSAGLARPALQLHERRAWLGAIVSHTARYREPSM
ncbi:hypothetical protein [Burkholderia cenocepacia]|uniref:hypothetical protein n=1 Tax=Burkholderia cenocepacia TaxID=95486 RepID=UPI0015C57CFF|nr:hypothetical protein [Burkholderia cenocepacia]